LSNKLGEILVELGLLEKANLVRALKAQDELGDKLGDILIKLGMIKEEERVKALSTQLDLPMVEKSDFPNEPLFTSKISANFLKKSKIVPLSEDLETVALAMADPLDKYAVEAMSMLSGKKVKLYIGMEKDIETALDSLYSDGQSKIDNIVADVSADRLDEGEDDIERLKDLASEAPIVRLVNSLFKRAYEERASDIHIEPSEHNLVVRYRVDGVLREVDSVPKRLSSAIVSRIKIMAHMNIAERRLAQDGRIRLRIRDQDIDMRVSTVPTLAGESVVLRLLEHKAVELDFDQLGFDKATLDLVLNSLSERHGILLVTGPTGSGKTTTLYTALKNLNSRERKIITVEDPVEYQIDGVTQIQVNSDIGLTFSNVLRSIVRQDPDIIMIGEMRDLETAEIAVQSALTGHLVLSTLHTNDAAGAITRLLDMGVGDYLLTSTVHGVLGQRLVRTLCKKCREPFKASAELVESMNLTRFSQSPDITLYRAHGCEHCNGTGFTGRIGIYEFLQMSDLIRNLVLKKVDSNGLYKAAKEEGLVTMSEDGIRKALAGITTIEEVLRVTRQY